MSQASGGFLLPLGPLMGQKRVSPAETESFSKSSKEESFPKTHELAVTSSAEDGVSFNHAVIEDSGLQTSFNSSESKPSKESITTEEFMQKAKSDYLTGSGPTNSFAKSLQHAETLLWNHFQPGWKWLMAKHQAEDSCSDTDSDDSLLTPDLDNRFISGKLAEAERIAFDLGLLPRDSEPFVQELCLHMLSRIALIHWDQVFCNALGSALKDKCFPDPERKGDTVRSRTTGLFLELFHPLCEILTWLNIEQPQNDSTSTGLVRKLVVPPILVRTVSHCITTMQTSSHWLMTKGFQFLFSWSMNQFLLLIQADLKLLRAMASKMLQLAETLCLEEISSHGIQETLLLAQVAALVKELGYIAEIFNTFPIKALTLFSTSCKRMAVDIFEQTMPVGRQWRVNFRSIELPSKPNEYATAAVQTVIGQVLKGIQPLPEDAQTVPLAEALTAFMGAWMDHILKQKIKFSLQGALQLKQDFDLVRDLICSDEQLSSELRQAVLSLRVFHQVDNAIICLLQQPTRKVYFPTNTCESFRTCCAFSTRTVDFSHGSLNSLDSLDLRTERIRANFQPEESTESDRLNKIRATGHPESYLAVNQQEWLSLRMDSNRRRNVLRLPCVNNTAEQ
ncbi:coiled-coil domain-containing protein 142 isoform X9 [Chiloscyllium punctatum]|uniref:coiled-coil domain-containing protein 142 isoform X9 n=1 Tax=Chiloscyllium punctatum TaxID=137246 RepID=UPI003B640AAA